MEEAEIEVDVNEPLRDKIKHVLTIYPCISHTMLQAGIGPQITPKVWRPVVEEMIAQGELIQDQISATSPSGRYITYVRIKLPA
jgi:hypothetical protein